MAEENNVAATLQFEVVSAQVVGGPKQYVSYTIIVKKNSQVEDQDPSMIPRRYSDFLIMYNKLRQEFPADLASFAFPKKAVIGNFSPELISFRKTSFQSLLLLIAQNEKLRESSSVLEFFQKHEKNEIVKLLTCEYYSKAVELLKFSFRLLNKLLTNRHPQVLQTLCLLLALCEETGDSQTQQFAKTAVCRFESVSDTDSLRYYVPLLQLCMRVLNDSDSSPQRTILKERLDCMKRRGIRVDGCPPLLDAVLTDYMSCLAI